MIAACMAGGAIHIKVRTCQWEVRGLMIKRSLAVSGRMAGIACGALVIISPNADMLIACLRVLMTCGTCIDAIVVGVGVALCTLIPYAVVCSAVYWEVLVIVAGILCRIPVCLVVTGYTIC